MTDDETCMNCENKVGPASPFCSENCEKEWDMKKQEEKENKERKRRYRKKVSNMILIGGVIILAIGILVFFYPQYQLGILKHDESYPRTYQIEDCNVQYDIKDGNIIFPTHLECPFKPNQIKADRLVTEINSLSDNLNKQLLKDHPEVQQKIANNTG